MALASDTRPQRRRLRITGTVQGVGFRPFVHALATRHGLAGSVWNTGGSVVVEIEGPAPALDSFTDAIGTEAPRLAQIDRVASAGIPVRGERAFRVAASERGPRALAVPPDAPTCDACLAELRDATDRRFRHPFISCTDCGPRFTIVRALPYDRPNTTMSGFPMCRACRAEYEDPGDRRFHAETIACPDCGPRLDLPLAEAVSVLASGGILAVKGLGGWHLACDAGSEAAVARLRARKARDDKPFAVMTDRPEQLAVLEAEEDALLRGPVRPVVLARRLLDAPLAEAVAPGSPWIGVLLPYTPVHHLLVHDADRPLVMTSGNRSDEPIAVEDDDARARLEGIADAFLGNDRPIHRRCEDSVARARFPIRRSRGWAPASLPLPRPAARPIVAVGAEQKATFCVATGDQAHLSPHLGDLDTLEAIRAFDADLALYLEMLGTRPAVVAHDLHPDYRSTRWALEQDADHIGVQHHHAHAAACMAEHGRHDEALAVVLDGTGYGTDGTLWGGELLRCDLQAFERVAHLEPVPMPGGQAAIREPWRMAGAYLERADRPVPWERWPLVRQSLAVHAPRSSGVGRLFDAIAALLGVRERITYEGQAAIELEQLAADVAAAPYACAGLRGADLVAAAHDDLRAGRPRGEIAAAAIEGVSAAFADACAAAGAPSLVVLSGGCLQNVRLAGSLRRRLEAEGFAVLEHRRVPPNDGGIAYGQAAVAAARSSAACA